MAHGLRKAAKEDISAILDIAAANLADYQRYQVTFWRRAGGSREQHATYLESRLADESTVGYVSEADGLVDGFIIASVISAPPVYNPGGSVALIDDFALRRPNDWKTVGADLLETATSGVRVKGPVITVVVAGHQDDPKRSSLKGARFTLASEWHVRELDPESTSADDHDQIRPAEIGDLPILLELADKRRIQYEGYQPIFWRNATNSQDRQRPFFERTLRTGLGVALVHEQRGRVDGFVIGNFVPSPAVFRPDRVTCLIDDFCVASPGSWSDIGLTLLRAVSHEATKRGAAQMAVICGHLDLSKRGMLQAASLVVSSEWWLRTD